jgi:hypothetical protein
VVQASCREGGVRPFAVWHRAQEALSRPSHTHTHPHTCQPSADSTEPPCSSCTLFRWLPRPCR